MHRCVSRLLLPFIGLGLLVIASATLAAAQNLNPPEEPEVLGAWLYGGYCIRCHGAYDTSVAGETLEAREVRDRISGDGRGCQVKWGIQHGGPLSRKEIDALTAFILAWQEAGGSPPDIPPLPPFPTFTPEPSPTPDTLKPTEIPSPTPLVETDPQIMLIIKGNPLALGARLYTRRCYRCHLGYEFGRIGIGMEEEKIKRTITEGKAGTSMPAFGLREGGTLKVTEIKAIVAYIQAWEKLGSEPALPEQIFSPPTPDPKEVQMTSLLKIPPIDGRVDEGLVLYGEYCQTCHGLGGVGAVGPSLRKDWMSVRADLTIRGTIKNGIPGTFMPAWGERLDEEELNSLVALLLEWSQDPQEVDEALQQTEVGGRLDFGIVLLLLICLPIGWLWWRRAN